jgi:hypothetical protein
MTVPVWPATLPQYFLRDGYSETDPDNLISSDTSIGPAKLRRRSTSAIRPIAGTIVVTEAQYAIFQSFRANDIKSGALPFTFPDPHTRAAILVRLHGPPTYSVDGKDWHIGIALEVLP